MSPEEIRAGAPNIARIAMTNRTGRRKNLRGGFTGMNVALGAGWHNFNNSQHNDC